MQLEADSFCKSIPYPIILIDSVSKNILSVNCAAAEYLGFTLHELDKLSTEDLFIDALPEKNGRVLLHLRTKTQKKLFEVSLSSFHTSENCIIICTLHNNHVIDNEKNEMFFHIVEQSAASIVITDLEGYFVYVNRAFTEFTGYSLNELLGETPRILRSGGTDEKVYIGLWKAISAGKQWKGDLINRKKNGSIYWASATIAPIRDKGGNIIYYAAIEEDVTAQKQTEEEVRLSRKKYKNLFDYAPIGIYQSTRSGRIVQCNRIFAEMLGYDSPEELLSCNLSDIYFDSSEREALIKKFDKLQYISPGQIQWRKKDGSPVWVELNAHSVKDENGITLYFEGFISDITERKLQQENLEQSERRFRELADLLPETVFETDIQGRLTYVNKYSYKMFGYNAEDFETGLSVFQMIAPSDLSRAVSNFKSTLEGSHLSDREYTAIKKDGTTFPIMIYTTTIIRNENTAGLRGFLIDISERKKAFEELSKAKEEADEANRLKSGFLSTLSHEIRTPLNSILGFNHILKDLFYESSSPEIKQYFNSINISSKRLLRTIMEIVDASRISADEFNVHLEKINLTNTVKYCISSHEDMAKNKNLSFNFNSDGSDIFVAADMYCIEAVISHLLDNAIKYSDKGVISISTACQNGMLSCSIKDEGIGMTEDYQKHLFKEFSQEDNRLNRPYEGNGLGLSLTQKYLKLMQGTISVESRKNEGTVVTFSLPLI